MKKLITTLLLLSFLINQSQTQIAVGPQSATFGGMTRGYYFTSPVAFNLCALYIPQDASAGTLQSIWVVKFNAAAPPAFPGLTTAYVTLFSATNVAANTTVSCNVPIAAGDIIGVYGSRAAGCVNSYDGVAFVTNIMGFPTTLRRSGTQNCINGIANPTFPIWSEIAYSIGRIFMYYNCCPTPTITIAPGSPSICLGTSVTILGGGATTYTWMPGNINTASISLSPSVTTNYTLSGSTLGCTGTNTVAVTVNPIPTITATATNSVICLGGSTTLNGAGASTYTWSGGITNSVAFSPTITTTYTVTGTSASGCTNTAVITITVLPNPVAPLLTSNSPVCVGGNLTFTASGGIINLTGPNGFVSATTNPTITNVSALANGIYTLIVSAGICTSSITSAVVINALPIPVANSNSTVCANQAINFTGLGGVTYTWTGPGPYTSNAQNPTIAIASATNTGVYTLSVTNASGCISSTTTNVVVNALPVIVTNSPITCLNTNINLTSNGGTGYAWSGPVGFTSALQNPTIANATALMSGAYTVTVTSVAGCTNTAITTVSVLPLPAPAILSNTPCVGATLNLNGSGGAVYSWSGPNGFISAVQNPSIANVTLPANGNYTLIATVGTCTATIVKAITVNALPIPVASNNAPICETKNLNLSGNGGGIYSWTGPLGFTSAVQNPTITGVINTHSGNYILTVTDANGCQANATTSVTILSNPSALANGATVCFGQPANLTASGGASYSWTGPNGFTSNIANPIIPIVNNITTGNYILTITGVNTCTSIIGVNVASNPLPVPTMTSTAKTCVNTFVSLQGSPGFLMYQWTGPNNFLSPNVATGFTATSINQSGIYVLSVTDNNGCNGSTSAMVIIDPLPNGTLVSDGKSSCVPFCANFAITASSSSIVSATWNLNNQTFAGTTLNYCFNIGGNYPVKAIFTDNNGCSNSANFSINAYSAPRADFEYSPPKPMEGIDNVVFTNTSYGTNTAWNWYFVNNNGYSSTQQNTTYLFQQSGTYPIAMIVKNKWGCTDTVVKTITIVEDQELFVPNSFTPNGDGLNDIFLPKGKGLVKYHLMVFNRWGQKIYETTDFAAGWDGAFKEVECKEDVYVWKITATFPQGKVKEYTGHVTLNR